MKIFYVEASVMEKWKSQPDYGDVNFFHTGKDIDDMKDRIEHDNWRIDFKYKKIEEVSGDEKHISLINDAIEELIADKKICVFLINMLVEIREELRTSKQWKSADRIRNKLKELGVMAKDEKLSN